ncbi:MAG TPA: SDR family oxidoreductase [Candidatus Blautia faecigallinarum]|uniref:SDR family oxidoreductase n=1 Tax=Candidatus Blautia faecigallinarum TaxID=2838488 RepID=A0A9D2DUX3_9FIRM|nr:SDR family oxidoreductase [Candidatus Blautia faecigallinarum]
MRLENKVIVVTGASAGMGKAIVERFAQEGAKIVAVARRMDRLTELAESLKDAPGEVVPYAGDVSKREDDEGMIEYAVEKFGRLDVLINNAGIMDDNTAVGDVSDEMLDRQIRVNALGPIYAMRKAVEVFLKQGDGGNIINTCSVGAIHHTAGIAYCASKAAIAAATKNTAFMYMEQGIRCNGIAPGGVVTDIPLVMPKADEFGFSRTSSLLVHSPELGMPEDIANAALFLASDESSFINGVILTCDGGWTNL